MWRCKGVFPYGESLNTVNFAAFSIVSSFGFFLINVYLVIYLSFFSLREYTSRMRSINVVNCWPFDETFGEETVKSLLPPIVVKRFTWWLDELQLLHSETAEKLKLPEKKTKKVFERGETSSRNVDMDLEGAEEGLKVVKTKSLKGKMKATKKRSIVEIFAVAPPVKRAISGEAEEEEEDASCNSTSRNVGINRARKNKKMKNTDVVLRKALRVVKKIKRKKAAEKRGGDEIGVPDKVIGFIY